MASPAFDKFKQSMQIGYEQWHEGIGYDMEALAALSPEELRLAEELVVARQLADWRDIEALDQIGSERALTELAKALHLPNLDVSIEAARRLAQRGLLNEVEIEQIIVQALDRTSILNGMAKLLRFAEEHPTAAVRKKLLHSALHGNDDLRVHAAALVHFLYGASASSFDWAHRPLYLKFAAKTRRLRRAAYRELCAQIGVDPESV
jgi:hypothetical protein